LGELYRPAGGDKYILPFTIIIPRSSSGLDLNGYMTYLLKYIKNTVYTKYSIRSDTVYTFSSTWSGISICFGHMLQVSNTELAGFIVFQNGKGFANFYWNSSSSTTGHYIYNGTVYDVSLA